MLDGTVTEAPAPAAEAAPAAPDATQTARLPDDPTAGADGVLYDGTTSAPKPFVDDLTPAPKPEDKPAEPAKEGEPKPADKSEETPEEKAAREAAETPEQKAEREAKEKADKASEVPETYEDFTLPEGVTLDPKIDGDFKALAKELNLTQAAAQRLIDLQVSNLAAQSNAAASALQAQQDEWQTAMKSDKEFGGDKLDKSLALANTAVKQFGDPELVALLAGPLGDHPALVRFTARVGRAVSEAPIVNGGAPAAADAASVLYGNMK